MVTVSPETLTIILAIVGGLFTWTVTVVTVVVWLISRFNTTDRMMYKELAKLREALEQILDQHHGRIMRLELQAYGSTLSEPMHHGPPVPKPPFTDED